MGTQHDPHPPLALPLWLSTGCCREHHALARRHHCRPVGCRPCNEHRGGEVSDNTRDVILAVAFLTFLIAYKLLVKA